MTIPEIRNKVARLWTDFTTAKAAFLDASISSRAAASTALSNAVWTNAKAAFLDAAISSISGGDKAPTTSGLIRPTSNAALVGIGSSSGLTVIQQVSATETLQNTWETLISDTGEGIISFLVLWQVTNASNHNLQARLTIDGNVVWLSDSNAWQGTGDVDKGICLIGATENVTDKLVFEKIPFKTGFTLEFQNTEGASTTTMRCAYRYHKTG